MNTFERFNVQVGDTWDVFGDAEFGSDWIVQHSPREYIGKNSSALPVPNTCSTSVDCDADFGLKTCELIDSDCNGGKPICTGNDPPHFTIVRMKQNKSFLHQGNVSS